MVLQRRAILLAVTLFLCPLLTAQFPPQADFATPSEGSGPGGTFTFRFSDPDGSADLTWLQVIVNSSLTAVDGCYIIYYAPSGIFYLGNDANTAWIGPISAGSEEVLSNGQCQLSGRNSKAAVQPGHVAVQVELGFRAGFAGLRNLYLLAEDQTGRLSDWQLRGVWSVSGGLQMHDVAGLEQELNLRPKLADGFTSSRLVKYKGFGELEPVNGEPGSCVTVEGTSVPCGSSAGGSTIFAEGEKPEGAIDGVNRTFQIQNAPSPASSLVLLKNGLLQHREVDYTLTGTTIEFAGMSVPRPGDLLEANYRIQTGEDIFRDEVIPAGAIDGSNAAFELSEAPNPVTSLRLYRNGLLQTSADYSLNGRTVAFQAGSVPQAGDVLTAFFRVR